MYYCSGLKTFGKNSMCGGPGQTLTWSGKNFTLKVWFYFSGFWEEMKLQNGRKEWKNMFSKNSTSTA